MINCLNYVNRNPAETVVCFIKPACLQKRNFTSQLTEKLHIFSWINRDKYMNQRINSTKASLLTSTFWRKEGLGMPTNILAPKEQSENSLVIVQKPEKVNSITQTVKVWLEHTLQEPESLIDSQRTATSDYLIESARCSQENSALVLSNKQEYFWSKKLVRWVVTSPNVYEFAITILHNFANICLQKQEDGSFIHFSLVPRLRFIRFTTSALASVVYHVAIGILFTPIVLGTFGKKESINQLWHDYWVGASLSTMGVFAGTFGVLTGDLLIRKAITECIPLCKSLVTVYLFHLQDIRVRINKINIARIRKDLDSVDSVDKMAVFVQDLFAASKQVIMNFST